MPTVTGFTAARMQAMDNASIVDAVVNSAGDLILTTRGGSTINAGRVKGDPGEALLSMPEMGSGVDLDNMVSTGYFLQSDDAEATVALHYPAPYQGLLNVAANPGSTLVWQTYSFSGTGPLAGTIWTRTRAAGVWSRWVGSGTKGWINFPYAANWSDYNVAVSPAQYTIEGSIVRLRGHAKHSAGFTAATAMGTLPAAFAPKLSEIFCVFTSQNVISGASSAGSTGAASAGTAHTHTMAHTHTLLNYAGRVDVSNTGVVTVQASANTPMAASGWVSLNGIAWDWTM